MEGSARFRGSIVEDTNSSGEVKSPNNFSDYASTWRTEMHHLTLRVTKLKAILEVDGVEMLECRLSDSYVGGYISLMSNKNTTMWDNLSVTALDYNGNVITFEEAEALPDTFDEEDPLIGEEDNDDGTIEIIGLAFKTRKTSQTTSNGVDTDNSSDKNGVTSLPTTGDELPIFVFAVAVVSLGTLLLIYFNKSVFTCVKNKKH